MSARPLIVFLKLRLQNTRRRSWRAADLAKPPADYASIARFPHIRWDVHERPVTQDAADGVKRFHKSQSPFVPPGIPCVNRWNTEGFEGAHGISEMMELADRELPTTAVFVGLNGPRQRAQREAIEDLVSKPRRAESLPVFNRWCVSDDLLPSRLRSAKGLVGSEPPRRIERNEYFARFGR
jgi:hypothetical protein